MMEPPAPQYPDGTPTEDARRSVTSSRDTDREAPPEERRVEPSQPEKSDVESGVPHEPTANNPDAPVIGWGFLPPPRQRVTPGLVLSVLPPQRAARLAERLCTDVASLLEGEEAQGRTARLLALLTTEELRRVARALGVDDSGHFMHVYLRLTKLC
jgi:hypothetical protein